jgi:serine/threonine-protein kinase RsbT
VSSRTGTAEDRTICEISGEGSLLAVRSSLRKAATELRFGVVAQTKLITAASELARNILRYASQGTMAIERVQDGARAGLLVRFEDRGPGIDDLDLALQDGYSTGDSMGVGLPGARRLVDEFRIESRRGGGTVVEATVWSR